MKTFTHVGAILAVMLLGSVVATFSQTPEITGLSLTNGILNVTFSGGELQTAPAVTGPWTDTGNTGGEYTESVAGGTNKFYRVRSQPSLVSNVSPANYVVQPNALAVDQLVYVDRSVTFTDVASLGGSTYIQTANDDKYGTGEFLLIFDVSTNVVVYVAHDDVISPKPFWLSAFADTGENLVTTSPANLSLYAQEFAAGTVMLSGNEGGVASSMYSVVVTPAPTAPPSAASNPNPTNSATDVSVNTILSWTPGSKAFSHDVYFGTANPPPIWGTQTANSFDPGVLSPNTTYYWRIDEKNSAGTTTNTVWSFTTGAAASLTIANLSPANYTVQYDALAVGQLVYVDRGVTFTDVASLGGSTYIQTANDDKYGAGGFLLTFDVSTNVVVYVAHDDTIGTKPTWLSAFSDTGENLVTTSPANLSLYAQEFAAGTVMLSGNEGGVSSSMYSVVVTPAPTAPPSAASNPNPTNSATDVSVNAILSWTPGSKAFSHDVYFGTANPPPIWGTQTANSFNPGVLSPNTTYYWRIDEKNSQGTTTGAVWSFTTGGTAPLTISNVSRPNYTVQYDALAVGQLIYVDRTYTFNNVASLGGSTYIKTANGDKTSTLSSFLTFDVSANVVVYVAHDVTITTKPLWLSAFCDTGEILATTSPATFSLWAQEFAAGTVTLDGNAGGSSSSMYSVVITLAPTTPPTQASNPSPGDTASGVSITSALSWTPGSKAFSHDVYFGTDNPPPIWGTQTANTFNPGGLSASTTYYWRIDEKNSAGTTTGTVWSFTTGTSP